jgi:molybdate transport system substrate-binding protein
MKHFLRILFLGVVVSMLLVACGSSTSNSSTSTTPTPTATPAPVNINVFGAASLTAAFGVIKTKFEAANPNVTVTYNFAGSNTLATQITNGAPADVFASADTNNMKKVSDPGLVNTPQTFARNKVVVIIPANNPGNIKTLNDLANKGVKIDVAGPSVPVGNYTLEVLSKMGQSSAYGPAYESAVKANFVSQETSVTGVVQKVELGEVDAGFVYVSDAFSAGSKVMSIAIPDQYNILADYPIATVKASTHPSTAESFVQYVLSADGQAILAQYHFIPVS